MGKGKEVSFDVRQLVIWHSNQGKSIREIGKIMFNVPKSTVSDILKRCDRNGRIDSASRSGRPRVVTHREKNALLRKVKENPRVSATRLTREYVHENRK